MTMYDYLLPVLYFFASLLFIVGLKGMSHPRTAALGNYLGMVGMGLAILGACFEPNIVGDKSHAAGGYIFIVIGSLIGAIVGAYLAVTVEMTAMPQMVALLNGFGGLASVLVGGTDLVFNPQVLKAASGNQDIDTLIAVGLSGLIGAVTFWGSIVAYLKLEEWRWFKGPITFPGNLAANIGLFVLSLGLIGMLVSTGSGWWYLPLVIASSILGVTLTNPIGGADMPVVLALLNSYSGLAGSATGFVIGNDVLIIAGSLVGASGILLTQIMCKAMNRSLVNVVFGGMGGDVNAGPSADEVYAGVRRTDPDSIALMLAEARRVVIVPGFGLAAAQAQHAVKELANEIEKHGGTVEYAIHPVAGRMPGHMNVLLAEADVPYEQLKEMDEINPQFPQIDVVLVIGANDVVNPLARTDPQSPIAGMPILDVDKAKLVVIVKRSLSPGFAGIPNPLFAAPNAFMFFADGKQGLNEITAALKNS